MIRRTASEVLRSLEARVARLEGRTASRRTAFGKSVYKGKYGAMLYITQVSKLMAEQWNILHPEDFVSGRQIESLFSKYIDSRVKVQLFDIAILEGRYTATGDAGLEVFFEPDLYDMPQLPGRQKFTLSYEMDRGDIMGSLEIRPA